MTKKSFVIQSNLNTSMEKLLVFSWSVAGLAIALFLFLLSPVAGRPFYKPVEINSGTGFKEIAKSLADNGIIRSRKIFLVYGLISGSAHRLKPGNYFLSAGSSTPAIILTLIKGPAIDKEITLPEGMTLKDIDTALVQNRILPEGALANFKFKTLVPEYKFLDGAKNLEGFLFPDTYRFFINSSTEEVIKKFLDNFEKKAFLLLRECQASSVKCQELLTTASLLEKEAPVYEDRQIIAGIIYKRLGADIALHIDATITYAKCGGAFLTCADPKVYRKDLTFQSPYNTYLYNGLPPGPIGNPGLEAIKAALNPVKSEYLYYLSDPKTKKTIFSRTLEEHIENREKYLGV